MGWLEHPAVVELENKSLRMAARSPGKRLDGQLAKLRGEDSVMGLAYYKIEDVLLIGKTDRVAVSNTDFLSRIA